MDGGPSKVQNHVVPQRWSPLNERISLIQAPDGENHVSVKNLQAVAMAAAIATALNKSFLCWMVPKCQAPSHPLYLWHFHHRNSAVQRAHADPTDEGNGFHSGWGIHNPASKCRRIHYYSTVQVVNLKILDTFSLFKIRYLFKILYCV